MHTLPRQSLKYCSWAAQSGIWNVVFIPWMESTPNRWGNMGGNSLVLQCCSPLGGILSFHKGSKEGAT